MCCSQKIWKSEVISVLSDTELQDLEFALMDFGLSLVQYLLTISQFLPFGMVVYLLCHCMLEGDNLLLDSRWGYN